MILKKDNPKPLKKQTSFSQLRKKSSLGKTNLSHSFIQQQLSFSKLTLQSTQQVQSLSNELDNIVRRRSLTTRNNYESEKYFSHNSNHKQHPIFNCLKKQSQNNHQEQIQPKQKHRKWSQNQEQKYNTCDSNNSYLIKGVFQAIQQSCAHQEEQDFSDKKQLTSKLTINLKQKKGMQNSTRFKTQDKKIKSRATINTQASKNIKDNNKIAQKVSMEELQKMGQILDSKRMSRPSSNRVQNSSKTAVLIDKTKVIPKYQKESPKTTNIRQPYNSRLKTCGNQTQKESTKGLMKKNSINQIKSNQKQKIQELKMTKITQHENEQQFQVQVFQKVNFKVSKEPNSKDFMKPTQMISSKQKQKLIQKLQKVKHQLSKNQVQIRSLQQINNLLDSLSSLIN